jgi:hypothetical protein
MAANYLVLRRKESENKFTSGFVGLVNHLSNKL